MHRIKILTVVGARPQFIKASALSRCICEDGRLQEVIVHTGQHFDENMSDIFFQQLSIPEPTYHLGISGGSHGVMTGRMMESLDDVMQNDRPDGVVVYGDTNSTLAGALTASKRNIPLFHIEAGLRSFNRRMPEEINRVLTDHISDLLFCSTLAGVENLKNEGIVEGVRHCGDIMYDVALWSKEQGVTQILDDLNLSGQRYALLTLHRAENTDDHQRLTKLFDYLSHEAKDIPIIFLVHPRMRKILEDEDLSLNNIRLVDPVSYLEMATLLNHAERVYTDSGGLQKEAYFHKVPCITLRDETEWVETIKAGWNRLWFENDYAPRVPIPEYGTGNSASVIMQDIVDYFK